MCLLKAQILAGYPHASKSVSGWHHSLNEHTSLTFYTITPPPAHTDTTASLTPTHCSDVISLPTVYTLGFLSCCGFMTPCHPSTWNASVFLRPALTWSCGSFSRNTFWCTRLETPIFVPLLYLEPTSVRTFLHHTALAVFITVSSLRPKNFLKLGVMIM